MTLTTLGSVAWATDTRAVDETSLPVYSVTKHRGFVPSLEYFKKQVFSRDVKNYKVVDRGQMAYATIHLDEGSIGVAPERCLVSPMYSVFETDGERVDTRYLMGLLKSPAMLARYAELGTGSAERRRSIRFDQLARLRLWLPSLGEQRRIADLLDRADAIRAKRREALARLDELTQSVFVDMFGGSSSGPTVQLESLLDTSVSHPIRTGPFGSQLLVNEFKPDGVPVLGIDNVVTNEFSRKYARFVDEEKYSSLIRYTVRPGDVLITIMGTCGRVAIVPDDIGTAIKHEAPVLSNSGSVAVSTQFPQGASALGSRGW